MTKIKDSIGNFFGGIGNWFKGKLGFGPKETVKDVVDKQEESDGQITGGRMIEILESIAGALGVAEKGSSLSPEDADKQLQSKFTEIHEEEEAERTALEEKQSKIRHYHETKRAQWLHKKKMSQLKTQGLWYMKKIMIPFLLFIAAMFLLWKKWDEWKPLAGITIALKEASKKLIGKITGIFAGLTKTLSTKFPRLFGGLAKTIPPAGVVDDVIKTTGGVADDVIKTTGGVADEAVKAAGGAVDNVAATGGSKLVKGLKVVGKIAGPAAAVGEAALDWSDQNEKFNRLKIAYENGEKLPMPDGSTRAISDKEFELIERAHVANRAGSVGKGGGSLAAASAAAAVAAPLLATGPLGWLAYGGIVIGSAIAGGMAGDKAATNIFEGGEIDDAQKLVNDFYANLPALPKPTTGLELENLTTDIKDSTATEAAGGNFSPTAIDTSTKVISETIINDSTPMRDEGLEFSNAYIFGHPGAARP